MEETQKTFNTFKVLDFDLTFDLQPATFIRGASGMGKTTTVLRYLQENLKRAQNVELFYFSGHGASKNDICLLDAYDSPRYNAQYTTAKFLKKFFNLILRQYVLLCKISMKIYLLAINAIIEAKKILRAFIKKTIKLIKKMIRILISAQYILNEIHNRVSSSPATLKKEPLTGGVKVGGEQRDSHRHVAKTLYHRQTQMLAA